MKKFGTILLAGLVLLQSCGSMSNLAGGTLIGSGAGAAIGAGIGYLVGGDGKGAAIGAAIGTAVGGGTGAIIGDQMDKKAKELAELENAQVETVVDINGLKAIKVTFDSGILFATNSATLSAESKEALKQFANGIADMPETNLTIYGHTDNTGTLEVNQKVSKNRAIAVEKYLKSCGIASDRMTAEGLAYDFPVASNDTAEGRAQNRRVEVYISANEEMVAAAEKAAAEQK